MKKTMREIQSYMNTFRPYCLTFLITILLTSFFVSDPTLFRRTMLVYFLILNGLYVPIYWVWKHKPKLNILK